MVRHLSVLALIAVSAEVVHIATAKEGEAVTGSAGQETRASEIRRVLKCHEQHPGEDCYLLPPGSLVVTPEDRCVVLTEAEAEQIATTIRWLDGSYPASADPETLEALALLQPQDKPK
jgi:hypothetical protein